MRTHTAMQQVPPLRLIFPQLNGAAVPPTQIDVLHQLNAGWRSFATDKEVRQSSRGTPERLFVFAPGLRLSDEERRQNLTLFGDRLLEHLTQGDIDKTLPAFMCYWEGRQFDIYMPSEEAWRGYYTNLLQCIALVHSGEREYTLYEMHSMLEPSWSIPFFEGIECIPGC